MRRFLLLALALSGAMLAWACGLNPQPYPPDNYDAAGDTGAFNPNSGEGGLDASSLGTDASNDATPGAGDDGGTDAQATDASTDASADGAVTDAPDDAPADSAGD